MMTTQWHRTVDRMMEEIMFLNDLFHCAFCHKCKDLDEKASCEGAEGICLDCHSHDCPTFGDCLLEGNFG